MDKIKMGRPRKADIGRRKQMVNFPIWADRYNEYKKIYSLCGYFSIADWMRDALEAKYQEDAEALGIYTDEGKDENK